MNLNGLRPQNFAYTRPSCLRPADVLPTFDLPCSRVRRSNGGKAAVSRLDESDREASIRVLVGAGRYRTATKAPLSDGSKRYRSATDPPPK